MVTMGTIDDILISNCYPSKKEMDALSKVNLSMLNLEVNTVEGLPELYEKVVFGELQMNRGDINANMIRSTQTRVKFK